MLYFLNVHTEFRVFLKLHCWQQTREEICSSIEYRRHIQHVRCTCLCVHVRRRERNRKRLYVLFLEKRFYPTHTINQLQTSTFKQRCSYSHPLAGTHTQTNTHNFRCRHTLSHKPLGFSYSRVFCLSPSVPGGLSEMKQKRKGSERRRTLSVGGGPLFCFVPVQMDPSAAPVATCPERNSDRAVWQRLRGG